MVKNGEAIRQYYLEHSKLWIHYLSIDCIIFGFHENQLKVLLVSWTGTHKWSLPGGFILKTESVDDAAQRILGERTGLDSIFLKQFHVFGEAQRYEPSQGFESLNFPLEGIEWSERTISLGYYALVEFSKVTPTADFLSDECRWWNLDELPPLLFDHQKIVEETLKTLRRQLSWQPVGYNLLPEKFTMPQLQRLYETILGRTLDPRNFQKKMLAAGILLRLEERDRGKPHKSPFLYQFNKEQYERILEEGGLSFI